MSDFKPKSPLFAAVNEKAQEYLAETGPNRQQVLDELLDLASRLAKLLVPRELSEEREDIAQEAMNAAWLALLRGTWNGKRPFSAYVNGTVKYLCFSASREKNDRRKNTVSLTPPTDRDEESDRYAIEHKLFVDPVEPFDQDAFLNSSGVTAREKQVVELWCEEYTYSEIATKTGMAEGTVSTHLHRSRQKIRRKWLSKNRRRTQSWRKRQSHSPRRRFLGAEVNWQYFVAVGCEIIECRGIGKGGKCFTRSN